MKELSIEKSDGERIRKAIIKHFEEIANRNEQSWINIDIPYILAWLEKQGELVNSLSKGLDNAHERIDGLIQKNNSLIEQNPAEWHREDEQNLNACLGYIPDEFLRRWLTNIIHIKYDRDY